MNTRVGARPLESSIGHIWKKGGLVRGICFASFLAMTSGVWAATTACEVASLASGDVLSVDAGLAALTESHSLASIVDPNPATNLIAKHPLVAMSAFQRAYAWSIYKGQKRIPDPRWRAGKVTIYPVFSTRSPETGGRKIVGQYEQIQTVVDYFRAGSRGDGSTSKMPLFTGPAGTGKTELLSILALVARNLAMNNPQYFLYTFEWKDLHNIPVLRDLIGAKRDRDGNYSSEPRRSALQRSPLVLLPHGLQKKVLEVAKASVVDMIGYEPRPMLNMDPQDEEIRNAVLQHALSTKAIPDLSEANVVKALSEYVTIRRRMFVGGKEFPIIAAQGRDVNYNQLFTGENAPVMVTRGSDNAFAHHLNGKVLAGDGGPLLLDEFFRNPEALRDVFLGVVESRRVDRGGAPPVHLDSVILGATNDESLEQASGLGTAKAHIDRSAKIPMRLSTHPVDIAETMLVMKGSDPAYPATLLMKKLDAPQKLLPGEEALARTVVNTDPTPADLDEVFAIPQNGEAMRGPDGRYVFSVSMGAVARPVLISPHTLMYIAYTVAATRMKTDGAAARELGNFGVVKESFFTDPVTRIRVLMDKLELKGPQKQELKQLTDLLKEGDSGMSNRDAANIWLTRAIEEASRAENEFTLTPRLAQKVFRDLLDKGTITYRGHEERTRWIELDAEVINNLIIPELKEDWSLAMSHGSGAVEGIYSEIMGEIMAISESAGATHYESDDGVTRAINYPRFLEIQRAYQEINQQILAPSEVINFRARYAVDQKRRHDGLWKAVTAYVVGNTMKNVSIAAMEQYMRTGHGEAETEAKFGDMRDVFINQLGYNERSLKEAISLIFETEVTRQQVTR